MQTVKTSNPRLFDMPLYRMMLKRPLDFMQIVEARKTDGEYEAKRSEAIKLMKALDSAPFQSPCFGSCGNPATYVTLYAQSISMMNWCDDCNPCLAGADRWKLTPARSYRNLLAHAEQYAINARNRERMVRHWAEQKGLPERLGSAEEVAFFVDLLHEYPFGEKT